MSPTVGAGVAAGVLVAALAGVHLAVPLLRRRMPQSIEEPVASVAGGVAAAYVFVHLLPELASGNRRVAEVLGDTSAHIGGAPLFLVALAGFLVLYGLDHLAASRGPTRGSGGDGTFFVHLGAFAIYNGLISYSLPLRLEAGATFAVLFTIAMGLHLLLTDRHLDRHHGTAFARIGRPVLAASLLVGLTLAYLLAPTRATVVSTLGATLAGFILFNVFNEELPSERRARFPAFAASAGAYAGLLLAASWLGG